MRPRPQLTFSASRTLENQTVMLFPPDGIVRTPRIGYIERTAPFEIFPTFRFFPHRVAAGGAAAGRATGPTVGRRTDGHARCPRAPHTTLVVWGERGGGLAKALAAGGQPSTSPLKRF